MKRSTRVFGARVLRSGRRLFATRFEEDEKRVKLSPVVLEDGHVEGSNKPMEIDGEEERKIKIKLGEFKKVNLVDYNQDGSDNVNATKRFGVVYTRKRKRTLQKDSSLKFSSSFEENCGSDKRYEKKYFKKVKTSLRSDCCNSKSGFDGKDVSLRQPQPAVSFSHCSYGSGDSSSSSNINQFSCFIRSNGIRFPQDPIPFFTVDINVLPFCFLYMHSTILLKSSFLSYAFIMHSVNENVTNDDADDVKLPLIVTTQRDQPLDKPMIVRKARSARKRVPRVALFKKCLKRNVWAHVETIVPVPGVREIKGYEEDEYVPFKLPDSYICCGSDEVTRSLEKSYPIYDMDLDDERWLKELNSDRFGDNDPVSEDGFEKIIDAFERGSYRTPCNFTDAASAIERCSGLASKENLEAVYSYWMTKRKKKRSHLIRVFQCYPRKRVRRYPTNAAVLRKKRSSRRRASQRCVGKQLDFFKGILNDENKLAKVIVEVHEAEESAKRAEAAAIVKRQEAQAAMETADLAAYRAAMALKIAAAVAATGGGGGGSVSIDCL